MANNLSEFENRIGYSFKDKKLLKLALTHSSYAYERKLKDEPAECNERLEFLGDSVVSLIVSEFLYNNFKFAEGELSKLKNKVVAGVSESEFSTKIGIGSFLLLGKGEEASGGRTKRKLLEDAFEALTGAIYLDGGFEAARAFALPYLKDEDNVDYKTLLQELIQKNPGSRIEYKILSESGPDHDKIFECGVFIDSNLYGTGVGRSKKLAEKQAAKLALAYFGEKTD